MPYPRLLARSAVLALLGGGVLHASCRAPTQIELVVTTDLSCAELKGVSITVGEPDGVEAREPSTVTTDCKDTAGGAEVGTLVIAPDGDKDKPVGIKVVAGVNSIAESCVAGNAYAGCIVARRRLNYVPHTELVLQIPLSRDCLDQACDPNSTCVDGGCKDSTISNPDDCTGKGCGEDALGGGSPGTGGGGGGLGGAGGGGAGPLGVGFEILDLPADVTDVEVLAVSDDGVTTTGTVLRGDDWLPCVWIGAQPTVLLIPNGAQGRAEAVSDDGSRVVGSIQESSSAQASVRWDLSGNAFGTHQIIGDTEIQRALACNDACSVIGGANAAGLPVIYSLGPSPSYVEIMGSIGAVLGLSGDGAVAGGNAGSRPIAWRASDAMILWADLQIQGGVTAVSDDGTVLVGTDGTNGFYAQIGSANGYLPLTGGRPQAVAGNAASWVAVGDCLNQACQWETPGDALMIQDVVAADYLGTSLVTAADITADRRVIVGVTNGPLSTGRRPYKLTLGP